MSDRPAAGGRPGIVFDLLGPDFAVRRGSPLPFGASVRRTGINFAVFARHASAVSLLLYQPGEADPFLTLPLDPRYNRTGDVWHAFVRDLRWGVEYAWRMDGGRSRNPHLHRYDPSAPAVTRVYGSSSGVPGS